MARSAGHFHRAKLKPCYLILSPVVTNDWCINWICPHIYSEPCRNRRDSSFAACSPSTDTPNITGEKSTSPGRDSNPGPFADCKHPDHWLSYPVKRSTRDTWAEEWRITIRNFFDSFRTTVTTRDKSSDNLCPCYLQQPVCWAEQISEIQNTRSVGLPSGGTVGKQTPW